MTRFACMLATACLTVLATVPAHAQVAASPEAVLKEAKAAFGFVPSFLRLVPKSGLVGAWAELKGIELNPDTALSAKEKALIGVAVASQIPCQFCTWLDTRSAYLAGATDQKVQEAVAMAALVRHWSTIFYGNQLDLEAFKSEFAGLAKAADEKRTKTMAGK